MTPFMKAGYTQDSKFRVMRDTFHFVEGDTVWLYLDDGSHCPMFTDGKSKEWIKLPYEASYKPKLELIVEDEPTYPNPPQKHKDIIIEWAKGAEIEYYNPDTDEWHSPRTPSWDPRIQYRVKPQKSEKDTSEKEAYIKKLEEELLEAQVALEKAKEEFKQYRINVEEASGVWLGRLWITS